MPTNLSIKKVPDRVVARLRERAAKHHRSLQGELMAILEQTVGSPERLTPKEVLSRVRLAGLRTRSESTRLIRADRNGR